MLEVFVKLQKEDLKRFYYKNIRTKIIAYFLGGLVSIFLLGFVSFIFRRDLADQLLFSIYCVVFLIIFLIFYSMYSFSDARRLAEKIFETDPFLNKETTYLFTKTGIEVSTKSSFSEIEWHSIIKVLEQKNVFAIYISAANAYIIPKKALKSKDDIETFTTLLTENVNQKK